MLSLGELLYWAATWIAVTVALLGLAAWLTDSAESWVGVNTFFVVAAAIWLIGRAALFFAGPKRLRPKRH